ncbi:MAG: hypothetical protein RLZZ505_236 [Verrucomicrobiota bacterium]|jgi:hypothetical protein
MKAFVFKENNGFIGRFEVPRIADIDEGFRSFVTANPVKHGSYIECDGRVWTVISRGGELVLTEGRQASVQMDVPDQTPFSRSLVRFAEDHAAAKETIGIGNLIKMLGIVIAIIGYILAFVIARGALGIMASILSATVSGLIIYAFGALLSAQGRILRVSLETAANTSQNLDEENRVQLMSISAGE